MCHLYFLQWYQVMHWGRGLCTVARARVVARHCSEICFGYSQPSLSLSLSLPRSIECLFRKIYLIDLALGGRLRFADDRLRIAWRGFFHSTRTNERALRVASRDKLESRNRINRSIVSSSCLLVYLVQVSFSASSSSAFSFSLLSRIPLLFLFGAAAKRFGARVGIWFYDVSLPPQDHRAASEYPRCAPFFCTSLARLA